MLSTLSVLLAAKASGVPVTSSQLLLGSGPAGGLLPGGHTHLKCPQPSLTPFRRHFPARKVWKRWASTPQNSPAQWGRRPGVEATAPQPHQSLRGSPCGDQALSAHTSMWITHLLPPVGFNSLPVTLTSLPHSLLPESPLKLCFQGRPNQETGILQISLQGNWETKRSTEARGLTFEWFRRHTTTLKSGEIHRRHQLRAREQSADFRPPWISTQNNYETRWQGFTNASIQGHALHKLGEQRKAQSPSKLSSRSNPKIGACWSLLQKTGQEGTGQGAVLQQCQERGLEYRSPGAGPGRPGCGHPGATSMFTADPLMESVSFKNRKQYSEDFWKLLYIFFCLF